MSFFQVQATQATDMASGKRDHGENKRNKKGERQRREDKKKRKGKENGERQEGGKGETCSNGSRTDTPLHTSTARVSRGRYRE